MGVSHRGQAQSSRLMCQEEVYGCPSLLIQTRIKRGHMVRCERWQRPRTIERTCASEAHWTKSALGNGPAGAGARGPPERGCTGSRAVRSGRVCGPAEAWGESRGSRGGSWLGAVLPGPGCTVRPEPGCTGSRGCVVRQVCGPAEAGCAVPLEPGRGAGVCGSGRSRAAVAMCGLAGCAGHGRVRGPALVNHHRLLTM